MILDRSALLAILLGEPGAERLLDALLDAPRPLMSVASWLEVALAIEARGGRLAGLRFDEFLRSSGIELIPVDAAQAEAARTAWRHFGRHRHSARLDPADCLAYALAKTRAEPLLYTGDGFARTDLEPALKS